MLVLHDLNHAARYAHHLIAMHEGRIRAERPPREIVTEQLIEEILGLPSQVIPDPVSDTPMVIPLGRRAGGPRPDHARRRDVGHVVAAALSARSPVAGDVQSLPPAAGSAASSGSPGAAHMAKPLNGVINLAGRDSVADRDAVIAQKAPAGAPEAIARD